MSQEDRFAEHLGPCSLPELRVTCGRGTSLSGHRPSGRPGLSARSSALSVVEFSLVTLSQWVSAPKWDGLLFENLRRKASGKEL